MAKKARRRNAQDATLINERKTRRDLGKELAAVQAKVAALERRVDALDEREHVHFMSGPMRIGGGQ